VFGVSITIVPAGSGNLVHTVALVFTSEPEAICERHDIKEADMIPRILDDLSTWLVSWRRVSNMTPPRDPNDDDDDEEEEDEEDEDRHEEPAVVRESDE
jgi:hypothetical protein